MKVKYNLSQFMAAAEYLAKYNDYLDLSPLEWLAKIDRLLHNAAKEGSTWISTGGLCLQLYPQDLESGDLIAEAWVDPFMWSNGDDYDFSEIEIKANNRGPRAAEDNRSKAA